MINTLLSWNSKILIYVKALPPKIGGYLGLVRMKKAHLRVKNYTYLYG